MTFTPKKVNLFMFFKLPAAWWCGVRLIELSTKAAKAKVKLKWLNQNPFKSIYFAVLSMAAELTTGVLVLKEIESHEQKVAMLIIENKAEFLKKAKGKIIFECVDSEKVKKAVSESIQSNESQSFWLHSVGKNETGEIVAKFDFLWSIKPKKTS
ncbi:MAG: DUF4442 domain-containing protein [Bacteroidota bacterium]